MAKKDADRPSSSNAMKHGGRSRKVIVGNESQEEFDQLRDGWRAEYEMEGEAGETLLEQVILNAWLLKRAERNYLAVEEQLAETPPMDWTPEQHKKLELFLRYKTTAERSFTRSFNMLRALRKDRLGEEMSFEKLRARMAKLAQEELQKARENEPKSFRKAVEKGEAESSRREGKFALLERRNSWEICEDAKQLSEHSEHLSSVVAQRSGCIPD